MSEADDVVAVVVHGEPGQDGDGDAGAGRQQRKPVLYQSLLFNFSICRYISTTANVTSSVGDLDPDSHVLGPPGSGSVGQR
jgi:hypothetical protein